MFSALVLLLAAGNSPALPPRTKDQCGWVYGRYAVFNGSSLRRIGVTGTSRIIAMRDEDDSVPIAIRRWEKAGPHVTYEDALFGEFKVCAVERRIPGHVQHVRILATRNLRYFG